jgi:hypothetical protein
VTAAAPSLPPSLASAYAPARAWLTNDANPAGKGPVSTGPTEPISDPVDGTAPVALNASPLEWTEPELAEQPPDYFAESAFPRVGPWPGIPEAYNGKEPFGTAPDDGITPAGFYKVPETATGFAVSAAVLPGHDRHSQDTDNAGWEQYTPSGRAAVRQGWKQFYPGVDNWWPPVTPNLARTRTAAGADQEIHGTVAQYGDLASSGGSTAYEAAPPPATTTQAPAAAGAGFPVWGF